MILAFTFNSKIDLALLLNNNNSSEFKFNTLSILFPKLSVEKLEEINSPTLSLTNSEVPPTSVAITGIPKDKASIIDTGKPSEELTLTNKSTCCF